VSGQQEDPVGSLARVVSGALAELRAGPRDEMPAWLRQVFGTGGHTASAAEKRQAWARFSAERNARAFPTGAGSGVFASMRGPGEVSPLGRRVFGAGS
jgi:hypothetical protein